MLTLGPVLDYGQACIDLFEDYQRCELKPEGKREECRARARHVYRMFSDLP